MIHIVNFLSIFFCNGIITRTPEINTHRYIGYFLCLVKTMPGIKKHVFPAVFFTEDATRQRRLTLNIPKKISGLIIIAALLIMSGCETVFTLKHEDGKNKIYTGTISHINGFCNHGRCLDAPFSFVLDTILLPVTIPWTACNYIATDPSEAPSPEERDLDQDQDSCCVKSLPAEGDSEGQ